MAKIDGCTQTSQKIEAWFKCTLKRVGIFSWQDLTSDVVIRLPISFASTILKLIA